MKSPFDESDCQIAQLTSPDGTVEILNLPDGRRKLTLKPRDTSVSIARPTCETSLPIPVIQSFLDLSFGWLCEALARHDDPEYVRRMLGTQLFAYFDPEAFRGKRLLDFGCGSGASTLAMARMLPETEIVGVELNAHSIELARKVQAARPLPNVTFIVSENPSTLPAGIGTFDFAMLSAVYEHLLPDERRNVMPLIWSGLDFGGVLFVNQTPYRYFPYEHHSTGLWLINYLPDGISHYMARKFSRINPEINRSPDWNVHLRGGIRGGTEGEILRNIRATAVGRSTVLQPKNQDRAAYWLACTNQDRHRVLKKLTSSVFRLTDKLWGTVPGINVDVVIRKDRG